MREFESSRLRFDKKHILEGALDEPCASVCWIWHLAAHLMKVANQLTWAGFLKAPRGRVGKAPDKPGDVVRATSPWLIALLQRTIA